MLVFDHPGVRHFTFCIVDYGISLIIAAILDFCFKMNGPVFQFSEAVLIEFVDGTGENNLFCLCGQFIPMCKEIAFQPGFNTVQQSLDQYIVSADRNTLIFIIEIVVVEHQADRQTFDDECRKFRTFSSPLFSVYPLISVS